MSMNESRREDPTSDLFASSAEPHTLQLPLPPHVDVEVED